MRKVPNNPKLGPNEDYFVVLAAMLHRPANGATTSYAEMASTLPLIERLEAAVGRTEVLLEETDWKLLCDRLKSPAAGFTRNSEEAFEMIEAVLNAEKIDVAKLVAQ